MKKEILDTQEIISNAFGLTLLSTGEVQSEEEIFKILRDKLSERVLFYIRTNMDKLFQALYRIDVDDSHVDQAFYLGEVHLVSKKLSELIIERQLKKLGHPFRF